MTYEALPTKKDSVLIEILKMQEKKVTGIKEKELARFRIQNHTFCKFAISKSEDDLNEKKKDKLRKTDDKLTSTEVITVERDRDDLKKAMELLQLSSLKTCFFGWLTVSARFGDKQRKVENREQRVIHSNPLRVIHSTPKSLLKAKTTP